MFEKLYSKGVETFIKAFNEEPLLVCISILIAIFMIYACIKLWRSLVVFSLLILVGIIIAIMIFDYKEKQSLEYQLAMQMIDENCIDTIELEKYMRYENITFVEGRQYRYGEVTFDKIARNYVCHDSKRTYSVDFILDIYTNRPTLQSSLNEIQILKTVLMESINK